MPSPADTAAGPTRRLFFALWPDSDVAAALLDLQRQQRGNGKPVPAANIHLTLAFLGDVSEERRACMEAAAATVSLPRFDLMIDRVGFWTRSQILWAGAGETPGALLDLVGRLNRTLVDCGYQPEQRKFQAHVTLARRALKPPFQIRIPPIVWPVGEFCLVESTQGERTSDYRVLGRWPLAA